MERAWGGISYIPHHPSFYASTLTRMWRLLDTDGIMLLQLPHHGDLLDTQISPRLWSQRFNSHGIETRYDPNDSSTKAPVMYIRKTPESPHTLPLSGEPFSPTQILHSFMDDIFHSVEDSSDQDSELIEGKPI